MLEKRVDPANVAGKILRVIPYQDFPSIVHKEDNGYYELSIRISDEDILGIPISNSPEPRKVMIGQTLFSKYKLIGLIIPFAYSKNSLAASEFEKRNKLFESKNINTYPDKISS